MADSLSAVKHAQVKCGAAVPAWLLTLRLGRYPTFGNNDPRVDDIAVEIVKSFMSKLKNPNLPERGTHLVHLDHHLQRGLREKPELRPMDEKPAAFPPGQPMRPGPPRAGFHDSVAKRLISTLDGISYTFRSYPRL